VANSKSIFTATFQFADIRTIGESFQGANSIINHGSQFFVFDFSQLPERFLFPIDFMFLQ